MEKEPMISVLKCFLQIEVLVRPFCYGDSIDYVNKTVVPLRHFLKRLGLAGTWGAKGGIISLGNRLSEQVGPKRGVLLVQLLPSAAFDHPRLAYFLERVPRGLRICVEFRNPTYTSEEFPGAQISLRIVDSRGTLLLLAHTNTFAVGKPDWLPQTDFTGLVADNGRIEIRNFAERKLSGCAVTAVFQVPLGPEVARWHAH
jgi:hypothetical protein